MCKIRLLLLVSMLGMTLHIDCFPQIYRAGFSTFQKARLEPVCLCAQMETGKGGKDTSYPSAFRFKKTFFLLPFCCSLCPFHAFMFFIFPPRHKIPSMFYQAVWNAKMLLDLLQACWL